MKKRSFFKAVVSYFKESFVELRRVVWPSWDSVKASTLVVFVSVLITAVILGFFDMALAKLMGLIV